MTRVDLGDGGPPLDLPDDYLPNWKARTRAAVAGARYVKPPPAHPALLRSTQETAMPNNANDDCTTPDCGTPMSGGGAKRGWVLMRIVGSHDTPRRWCSMQCATVALVDSSALRAPALWLVHRRPPAKTPTVAQTVRAWAAAHNVDCPRVGRVPKTVMDAYVAAHREASA